MSSSSSSNPSSSLSSSSSSSCSVLTNHSTLTRYQKYKLWEENFDAKLKILKERYSEFLRQDLEEEQRIELKRKNAMVQDRLDELCCYWVDKNRLRLKIESLKPTTLVEVEALEKLYFGVLEGN